jgi:signal transduction histidine kinase
MNVLYIEDDDGLTYLLREALEAADIQVTCAATGEAGLELLKNGPFDAILLDNELPQMSGIEVIERLNTLPVIPPVIMVTGAGNEEIAVQAMRAGANDYIVKDSSLMYLQALPGKLRQVIRERELNEARVKAEQAIQREKDRSKLLVDFIQNASHEFRTPLTLINTASYFLSRSLPDPKYQKYIEQIQDQSDAILELVSDLLRLTELDSIPALDLTPMEVTRLLKDIPRQFEKLTSKLAVSIELIIPEEPVYILTNLEVLADGLYEIVDNAIRYSHEGGVVRIELTRDEAYTIITVSDDGVGVSAAHLPHLTERFYRVDKAHTTPGFGLGLAMAMRVVDLHSGQLDISSELDRGMTVRVSLLNG